MLTTTAKASGRKLTLTVIKNLDKDRQPWMAEVVLKSGLLGQHDTIRTKWVPQNQDYQVKVTGMAQAKAQPSLKEETSSSITSMEAGSDGEFTTGSGGEVKKEKSDHTTGVGSQSSKSLKTPVKEDWQVPDDDEDNEKDEHGLNNMQLEQRLRRMEILNRMRELELVQLLRDTELANVRQGVTCWSSRYWSLRVRREQPNREQKGKGKGRGKEGKGARDSPSGYGNTSKPVCHAFLAGKHCDWGEECEFEYEHDTQAQLDARENRKQKHEKEDEDEPM
jgi:hypothetical protein